MFYQDRHHLVEHRSAVHVLFSGMKKVYMSRFYRCQNQKVEKTVVFPPGDVTSPFTCNSIGPFHPNPGPFPPLVHSTPVYPNVGDLFSQPEQLSSTRIHLKTSLIGRIGQLTQSAKSYLNLSTLNPFSACQDLTSHFNITPLLRYIREYAAVKFEGSYRFSVFHPINSTSQLMKLY